MAPAKVTFVNKNDKSKWFMVNLFGPERSRVKVANVLAGFNASAAIMEDRSLMEADNEGLSLDTFEVGGTYNLDIVFPANQEGPPLSKPASWSFQEFVRLAGHNFLAYEQKKDKFLTVSGDLLGNYPKGCLIWIRKCYIDFMRILDGAEENDRFIFRGSVGVGKSLFTLVWISYLATQRKKVVFKAASDSFYLLDFKLGEEKAFGPYSLDHLDLQIVLYDSTAWLILDDGQATRLDYPCRMLLACSNKKDNYYQFAKNPNCEQRFVPVWAQEEVEKFLVDFEPHRSEYKHLTVPDKETVVKNFSVFGGVAQCLFASEKSQDHEKRMRKALANLDYDACRELFSRTFRDDFDLLVHMNYCGDKYKDYHYDFASKWVLEKVWQVLQSKSKIVTVYYLEMLLNGISTCAAFESLFELVAHSLMAQGGKFKRKRVYKDREAEEIADLHLEKKDRKVFEKLGDLVNYHDGEYYEPKSKNLQSVDAVILPNMLLQFFHRTQGSHGYKMKGLQDLDDVLKKSRYSLLSCVPKNTYDTTGFQNFLDAKGEQLVSGHYYQELQGKMKQYVVMVDYNCYGKLGGVDSSSSSSSSS